MVDQLERVDRFVEHLLQLLLVVREVFHAVPKQVNTVGNLVFLHRPWVRLRIKLRLPIVQILLYQTLLPVDQLKLFVVAVGCDCASYI